MNRIGVVAGITLIVGVIGRTSPPLHAAVVLPRYHVTDLGDLPGGYEESYAYGINNRGQVVGESSATSDPLKPFLWTPTTPNGIAGTMVDLGDLPGGMTRGTATSINSSGQVTGVSYADDGARSFLWTPATPNASAGTMVNLGGAALSYGQGINDRGQVAGERTTSGAPFASLWTPTVANGASGTTKNLGDLPGGIEMSNGWGINGYGQVVGSSNAEFGSRGFLWTPTAANGANGSMIDLGELPGGSTFSEARAVNARGQVVGSALPAGADAGRAFLWTPTMPNGTSGSMLDLGVLPDVPDSYARGINAGGEIVGTSGQFAFVWRSDVGMHALNTLLDASGDGWSLAHAFGINDYGQIVGYGTIGGDTKAFLLTPVPEPAAGVVAIVMTWTFIAAGTPTRRGRGITFK
jgi:probable HAF family extracellular repeat protein